MTKNKIPLIFIQRGSVSSFIVCALCLLAASCASPRKVGSQRVAAVLIKGSSADAIKASVKRVFEKHDFDAAPEDENELIFQKKASFMKSFVYADWYSGAAWVRAKLYLKERQSGETLLDCDVYVVQEPDEPLFQKARKLRSKQGEFQSLLEEVKRDVEH